MKAKRPLIYLLLTILLLFSCAGIPESPEKTETGTNISASESKTMAVESSKSDLSDNSEEADIPDPEPAGVEAESVIAQGPDKASVHSSDKPSPEDKVDGPEKAVPVDESSSGAIELESLEALAEPLGRPDLISRSLSRMPDSLLYIDDGGQPLCIIQDLDKNGYEDLFLLTVSADDMLIHGGSRAADITTLKDSGRLFYEKKEYIEYTLLVFYQFSEDVHLRYSIPLCRELVLTNFRIQTIREGSDFPFGLAVSFKTRGGTSEEWVILNGRGISRFKLEETLSVIPVVEDIDADGYVDIVLHQQAAEEGIGYETFLTWYRWNGLRFQEEKSTNVVRNLRNYFSRMALDLLTEEREVFLDSILLPETGRAYKASGKNTREIFRDLFVPVNQSEIELFDLDITDVVYPVLMETPFTYQKRRGFEFPFTLGIITDGGGYYFRSRLVMNRNPFSGRQFGFLPVE